MVIFLVWHECSFSLRWACPRGRSWTVTSLIRLFTATLETSDNIFIFVVIFWIVDACKCHTDNFWQLFAIIDDKQFRDPIHGRRPSQLSGGCVCVWGKRGMCIALIKEPLLSSLCGAFHCSHVQWKGGLVPAWQARALRCGSITSASIAGLSGDPVSRLPEREVVSAGGSLASHVGKCCCECFVTQVF